MGSATSARLFPNIRDDFASDPRATWLNPLLIPTRVKADSFQGFQNGASSESCPSASATGPMHDAQCGLVSGIRGSAPADAQFEARPYSGGRLTTTVKAAW